MREMTKTKHQFISAIAATIDHAQNYRITEWLGDDGSQPDVSLYSKQKCMHLISAGGGHA